jgi:hypothetical protein
LTTTSVVRSRSVGTLGNDLSSSASSRGCTTSYVLLSNQIAFRCWTYLFFVEIYRARASRSCTPLTLRSLVTVSPPPAAYRTATHVTAERLPTTALVAGCLAGFIAQPSTA